MNIVSCAVRLSGLAAELQSVPLVRIQDDSGHPHFGGPSGWIHGLSNTRIRLGDSYPLTTEAIEDIQLREDLGDVVQVMVNKLGPGALLAPHRDGRPDNHRYHLPIVSNPDAYWWDELGGKQNMLVGWWYGPVPYCGILHSAGNPGSTDRLHLVVDFEKRRD